MEGGEIVEYNIDLTASLAVSKPDNHSKAEGHPSNSAGSINSFKDSLRRALTDKSQKAPKADDVKDLRRVLIFKSKTKLEGAIKENVNQMVEYKESQEAEKDKTAEEILYVLEELVSKEDIPDDKQALLIEKAEEILKKLQENNTNILLPETANLQTKLSELLIVMKKLQGESGTLGGLTGNEAVADMAEKLIAIVAKYEEKVEAPSKSMEDNSDSKLNDLQSASNEKVLTADSYPDEDEKPITDSTKSKEARASANQDNKGGPTVTDLKPVNKEIQPANKESQSASEINDDDVKVALDSKVDKVTAEDGEGNRQGNEAGENKEAKEIYKAANTIQNKPANEEMSTVKQEEIVLDNKPEAIQNQAVPVKAQTVSKADIINQIVKKAEIVFNEALPEMRMQLEPENLGKLTLKIAVEKGLITAKFVAESYEVKKTIESNFNELKDMLQEKGLTVQNLSVSVGHNKSDYDNSNTFQQWKEQVKLRGRSTSTGGYNGYLDGTGIIESKVNPYSVHNGKFDHRA
jgi:flagellar hook-length control protein FliK